MILFWLHLKFSGPTGFEHVAGIKTDGTGRIPSQSYNSKFVYLGSMQIVNNMENLDPAMRKLFKHSGIDVNKLKAEDIEEIKKSDEYQEYQAEFERKRTERRMSRSGPKTKDPAKKRPMMAPINENTSGPPSIPQRRNPQPTTVPSKAPPATPPRRDRNPAQKPSIPAPTPPRPSPKGPPPSSKPSGGPPPPPPPPGKSIFYLNYLKSLSYTIVQVLDLLLHLHQQRLLQQLCLKKHLLSQLLLPLQMEDPIC